jgi:hypothetical protein
MKIYYDEENNKEVIDVSGNKSETTIKVENQLSETLQSIELNENEACELIDGVLTKYNTIEREAEKNAENKEKKDAAIVKLKALGLTDEDIEVLI